MEDAIFETVRLETRTGELVARVNVPKFAVPCDVLIWGERFFKRVLGDKYVEVSVYYVVPEMLQQ